MNEWTTDPAFRFRKKELRGPDPVGAKAMRQLARLVEIPRAWTEAESQFERLRRSGYVVRSAGESGCEYAVITLAGRALLGQQPRVPK